MQIQFVSGGHLWRTNNICWSHQRCHLIGGTHLRTNSTWFRAQTLWLVKTLSISLLGTAEQYQNTGKLAQKWSTKTVTLFLVTLPWETPSDPASAMFCHCVGWPTDIANTLKVRRHWYKHNHSSLFINRCQISAKPMLVTYYATYINKVFIKWVHIFIM